MKAVHLGRHGGPEVLEAASHPPEARQGRRTAGATVLPP